MNDDLQARQALKFIADCMTERGYPPTRRELAAHLELDHAGQAQRVIERLVESGAIEVKANSPRAITVVRGVEGTEAV